MRFRAFGFIKIDGPTRSTSPKWRQDGQASTHRHITLPLRWFCVSLCMPCAGTQAVELYNLPAWQTHCFTISVLHRVLGAPPPLDADRFLARHPFFEFHLQKKSPAGARSYR